MKYWALLLCIPTAVLIGQGWIGERRVSEGDPFYSVSPRLAVDSSGHPWVVWHGYWPGFSLMHTKWLGDRWDDVRAAIPDTEPGLRGRYGPSLCFDQQGQAWAAWQDAYANNRHDVSSSNWIDTCWGSPVRINRDTIDANSGANIGSGGGEIWCAWDGWRGRGINAYPYAVDASRWDGSAQRWVPVARIAPPDSSIFYWWNDMVVDTRGRPHVVWSAVPLYCVLYSFYDGDSWSQPVPVNDTAITMASWMAASHIVVDRTGMMHLSFTGATAGALHRDIFYSRNDGTGWSPPVRVTQDSAVNYDEWYSDVAADRPDNVWVTWDRQGEGSDQFRVYASHYDGNQWSPEVRLDGDSAHDDGVPAVCVGLDGLPWVAWSGEPYASGVWEIYYNRYVSVGVSDDNRPGVPALGLVERATTHPGSDLEVTLCLAVPAHVHVDVFDQTGRRCAVVYDGTALDNRQVVRWHCSVPKGTYFCRVAAGGRAETRKFVVTGP